MSVINLKSTVGTIDIYRVNSTDSWTELPDIEVTNGGNIINNIFDYVPHSTGIKCKIPLAQEYADLSITVAKNVDGSAFSSSNMRILNDLSKAKTIFELGKAVPVDTNVYEVTVWTGFINEAESDNAETDNIQEGEYTFSPSSREEYTGSKNERGEWTLTLRS